jgi:hypothetical protein
VSGPLARAAGEGMVGSSLDDAASVALTEKIVPFLETNFAVNWPLARATIEARRREGAPALWPLLASSTESLALAAHTVEAVRTSPPRDVDACVADLPLAERAGPEPILVRIVATALALRERLRVRHSHTARLVAELAHVVSHSISPLIAR